jgi:hypothetical protein
MSYVYVEGLSAADVLDMVGQLPDLPKDVSIEDVATQNEQESGNIRITWSDYVVSSAQLLVQDAQMNVSIPLFPEENIILKSRASRDSQVIDTPAEHIPSRPSCKHFEDPSREVWIEVRLFLCPTSSKLATRTLMEGPGNRNLSPNLISSREIFFLYLKVVLGASDTQSVDMNIPSMQTHVEGSDTIREAGINIRPAQHRFEEQVFWKKSTITVFGTNGASLSSEQVAILQQGAIECSGDDGAKVELLAAGPGNKRGGQKLHITVTKDDTYHKIIEGRVSVVSSKVEQTPETDDQMTTTWSNNSRSTRILHFWQTLGNIPSFSPDGQRSFCLFAKIFCFVCKDLFARILLQRPSFMQLPNIVEEEWSNPHVHLLQPGRS